MQPTKILKMVSSRSPYKKNYFCRNCSGFGHGHRHWIPKEKAVGNPPRCPDCGSYLKTRPIQTEVEGEVEVYQLRLVSGNPKVNMPAKGNTKLTDITDARRSNIVNHKK